MPSNELLQQLTARRDRMAAAEETLLLQARSQGRDTLTPAEAARHQQAIVAIGALTSRIGDLQADETRAGTDNPLLQRIRANQTQTRRPTVSTHVLSEPEPVYARTSRHSFAADLVKASTAGLDIGGESRRRLQEHADYMNERGGLEHRDLTRVDGSGGYAVPPAWLMDQYVSLARAGRPFADLCTKMPLPGGTDSINLPKLLTGTAVAIQTADNQPVQQTDLTDTFINVPVRTIAGQQSVAIQLIDQSPIAFDEVILSDLARAHATLVDTQVLYGTGSSGQVLGITQTPGVTAIPVSGLTDVKGLYAALANAYQTILTTRFLPPTAVVMHPRRWAWALAMTDTTNRPLFTPIANGPMNAAGVQTSTDPAQIVGHVQGLPVTLDPSISVTSGGASNEDTIFVAHTPDLYLWEGGVRARVLPQPKAANLEVLIQLYSYIGFSAARYPASVVELTGLTPPTF
jgi:HK97 family phage major capsid protein